MLHGSPHIPVFQESGGRVQTPLPMAMAFGRQQTPFFCTEKINAIQP